MEHIKSAACLVILAWSVWSALSCRVRDGIIGKIIFGAIAVSATAVLQGGGCSTTGQQVAEATLTACIAAYAIRQVFLQYAWSWISKNVFCNDCQKRRSTDR